MLIRAAVLLALPGTAALAQPVPADSLTAFVGAHVVSMRTPEVLRDYTVIVRNGVISAIGPRAQVQVPAAARRIDASGEYLMPGLVDFHVHVGERRDLSRYLAHGVTTIVNMGGNASSMLAWRDSVRARAMVGPDIYVGAFLNGPLERGGPLTVQTTADARDAVQQASERRYDFIKVYNSLTEPQFLAAMEEARARRLPVIGHAVRSIGLARGFALGQQAVAHAEEYMYDGLRVGDTAGIPAVVEYTRRARAGFIANLSAYDAIQRQWGKPAVVDSFLRASEASDLSEFWRTRWRNADYATRRGSLDRLWFLKELTLAMQRGGVIVLLGTDSPSIPGMFAGASIHEELRLLVDAGLSPYEALSAGTRNAGGFAQRVFGSAPFGTIATGQRADLILLRGNPLSDVAHARHPVGVMVRGRWLPAVSEAH